MILYCEQEAALIAALEAGQVDDALAGHADHCEACRQSREVWAAMQSAARADVLPVALPSPGLIWWKAQLAARRAAVTRAERPLRAMQWTGAMAMLAGLPWWAGLSLGAPAALFAAAGAALFVAISAGGLLYYWKRG